MREESGLHGARELDPADLGGAVMCINVDGQDPNDLIVGAVGQENWEVEIIGKASHAGVAPEKGISATLVGAVALAEAKREGWFGKVAKAGGRGTSNVGIFGGKDGKACRRRDQCRDRLRLHQGRGAQPDIGLRDSDREGLRAGLPERAGGGEGR